MGKWRFYFSQPQYWSVEVEGNNYDEARDNAWNVEGDNYDYGDAEIDDDECLEDPEDDLTEDDLKDIVYEEIDDINDADAMKCFHEYNSDDPYGLYCRAFCKDEKMPIAKMRKIVKEEANAIIRSKGMSIKRIVEWKDKDDENIIVRFAVDLR